MQPRSRERTPRKDGQPTPNGDEDWTSQLLMDRCEFSSEVLRSPINIGTHLLNNELIGLCVNRALEVVKILQLGEMRFIASLAEHAYARSIQY